VLTEHQEYIKMVNATLDGLTLIDREYRYLIVNDAYLNVKNIDRNSIVGKTVEEIWGKIVFYQNIKPHLDKAFHGEIVSYQLWIDFSETNRKYMEVTYWPHKEKNGVVSRVVVNSHDITDLKLIEMELQKNLRISENSVRVKSMFLANMSHEIRTPLHAILSMVEFLEEENLPNSAQEHLSTLKNSSSSLLRIVNDILDFSKMEDGKMKLDIIKFNLKATLREVYDLMLIHAKKKSIKFSCEIDSRIPHALLGDPGRIKQVLLNLLSNAIKFTPANGEIEMVAKVILGRHEGTGVQFIVKDNGRGIDASQIEGIFNVFDQGHAKSQEGTGLGLPICQHFVKLMGGEIEVQSTPKQGSRFLFHIPLASCEENTPEEIAATTPEGRIIIKGKLPEHLLEQVKNWPYAWVAFEEMGQPQAKDQLLLSVLREESALEVLAEMKALAPQLDVPIVVITQTGKKGEAALLQELGVKAYLSEPYASNSLKLAMEMVKNSNSELITKHSLNDAHYNGRKRILVVEDNPINQKILVKHLQNLGLETEVACNGQEACDVVLKNSYDFIFMDIRMPVMDGMAATKEIRKNLAYQDIPIVALTADIVPEVRAEALACGMQDFIGKPFTKEQIRQCIEKHLYS
jgi:signal transduction histidine kinase/CheY-like chemotaxis protein